MEKEISKETKKEKSMIEVLDEKIAKNNKLLLSKGFKLVSMERKNMNGESYEVTFGVIMWRFSRKRGRTDSYYTMETTFKSEYTPGSFKQIKLELNLNANQVQYLNYMKDNFLASLQVNQAIALGVRTRFVYGLNVNGNPFIRYHLLLSDRIVLSDFIQILDQEMIFDALNGNAPFNIYLEKSKVVEEMDTNEVSYL